MTVPAVSWLKQGSPITGSVDPYAAATDSTGSIFLAGSQQGGYGLSKLDSSGAILWTRSFGSAADTSVWDIKVVSDGSIYLAGTANSFSQQNGISPTFEGENRLGLADAFIQKLDSTGTVIWTRLLGTSVNDLGTSVGIASDGSSFLAGWTVGSPDGTTNQGGITWAIDWDVFLTKYSSSGVKQWTRLIGVPGTDTVAKILVHTDDSVYITGRTYGALNGATPIGNGDDYIAKYDSSGNAVWTVVFGTTGIDHQGGIALGADGSVFVASNTSGMSLRKYSAAGALQWVRTVNASNVTNEGGLKVAVASDGAIFLAGNYSDASTIDGQTTLGAPGQPGSDAFVSKYDSSGTLQWTRLYGTASNDDVRDLIALTDGVLLVGNSQGTLPGLSNTSGGFALKISEVVPTYTITASSSSASEGQSVSFSVATNIGIGASLNYTISGVSSSDLTGGALTGTATVNASGVASFSLALASDQTLEGNETLTVTVQGQSASTTIVDTSTTPAPAPSNPICFLKGTIVSLKTSELPVEALSTGHDIAGQNQFTRIKWIGYQRRTPEFAQFDDYLPVKICAGALEENVPVRDLYLSPDHAVLVDGHLIHAQALVNGRTIIKMTEWEGDIEYYHIETENHEIIFAEGVPCETFIDNVSREQFDNYAEYQALYPYTQMMRELPLPRVKFRRQMPSAIWRRLMERADLITATQDQA